MWTPERRGWMARIEGKTKRYPSDLTDEEWRDFEPLLPRPARTGRLDVSEAMIYAAMGSLLVRRVSH